MKLNRVRVAIPSIFIFLAISYFLLQPLIEFQTQYFDTPEQAMVHSSGMVQDSKVVQTLLINTEYNFAFCVDNNDALCIKDIDSWTLFGHTKYRIQDGFSVTNYVCNIDDLGIYTRVNYYNKHNYFSEVQTIPKPNDTIIGGLTRLPKTDSLFIDGKKPTLHSVKIKGVNYTVWYIKNDRCSGTIVNYDDKYFCTF